MAQTYSRLTYPLIAILGMTLSVSLAAETSASALATRMATRLAIYPTASLISQMTPLVQAYQQKTNPQGLVQAAALATATTTYGDDFLFNLFAPMCSLNQNPNMPMNPCIATLMYIAWTGQPWTDALEGPYVAFFQTPTPAPTRKLSQTLPTNILIDGWSPTSTGNNWTVAYNEFLKGNLSYVQYLAVEPQSTLYTNSFNDAVNNNKLSTNVTINNIVDGITGKDVNYSYTVGAVTDIAGVLTLAQPTYDGGNAGTNRRFVEFLFQNFLASPLANIRDATFGYTTAFDGIRSDVFALAPDTTTLTGTCATCHGGIDRMAAAFNLMDYDPNNGSLLTQATTLTGKLREREIEHDNYYSKSGGAFEDSTMLNPVNAWSINYTTSPYGTFAWGAKSGTGIAQLAAAAAATDEFRIALINNIWSEVCGGPPSVTLNPTLIQLAKAMRLLYQDSVTAMVQQVAAQPACLGQ